MDQPPGFAAVVARGDDVRPGDPRAAAVYAGVAQQSTSRSHGAPSTAHAIMSRSTSRISVVRRTIGAAETSSASSSEAAHALPRPLPCSADLADVFLLERTRRRRPRRRSASRTPPTEANDDRRAERRRRGIARSSSRCRRSSSWRISTKASARPTSARRSKRRSDSRSRNGSKIRSAGIHRIHPDDKERWSIEAAEMFLSGEPLRSAYRVIARDGRVLWFHCQAGMIRRSDGRPWFIHGVGVDITDLKRAEQALQEERNLVSAILDTVGALVVVLDPCGPDRAVQSRLRADVGGDVRSRSGAGHSASCSRPWRSRLASARSSTTGAPGTGPADQDGCWITAGGDRRIISWSGDRAASARRRRRVHHRDRQRRHRAQAPRGGAARESAAASSGASVRICTMASGST